MTNRVPAGTRFVTYGEAQRDFLGAKSLAQIAAGKPVGVRQAAKWLKAVAEAVQFAHQRGGNGR